MIVLALALALAQAPNAPPPPAPPQPSEPPVLTLEDALKQAQAKNLDLVQARARLAQAHEFSAKAWAGYLPTLTLGASYTRNNVEAKIGLPTGYAIRDFGRPTSGPGLPGSPSNYAMIPTGFEELTLQKQNQLGAQAQLQQALIVPALWPAIKNAYLGEQIAELSVENARREVLFAVAQLYYGATGLKEAVQVQRRMLELDLAHEKDAKVRYEAGALPKVGLLRAQIDRARGEEDLKRAENAYDSARVALATLLDRAPDFSVARPPPPPPPPGEAHLEEDALTRRPDVVAAAKQVELAERNKTVTVMQYLPAVVGTAVYRLANVQGFTGQYDSWALGVGLQWTLWDGGLRESALREDDAKIAEAEAARRAAENKAKDEIARARLDLDSARSNRAKADEQLNLARENMQLVQVNYQAGAATYLEESDANAALLAAEVGAVAESLNADLAALRLLKAAGAFDPRP